MLNLLPYEQKKKIEREYWTRFAVVALLFGVMLVLILFVFALPSYVFSKMKLNEAVKAGQQVESRLNELQQEEASISPEEKENMDVLSKNIQATSGPTDLIEKMLNARPAGVSIKSVAFQIQAGEETVNVIGVARTRDNLIGFRQNLLALGIFKEVDLPIASLGPARNNEFNIEMKVKGKGEQ
jgi:Tfp pilus assembly protein PilN